MPYDPARHGPQRIVGPGFHRRVHDLVRTVPNGTVTTYGDVAAALGSKNVARHVGYALAALTDDGGSPPVPWWRVVAAGGRLPRTPAAAQRQAQLLIEEGLQVERDRVLDFARRRHVFAATDESSA